MVEREIMVINDYEIDLIEEIQDRIRRSGSHERVGLGTYRQMLQSFQFVRGCQVCLRRFTKEDKKIMRRNIERGRFNGNTYEFPHTCTRCGHRAIYGHDGKQGTRESSQK